MFEDRGINYKLFHIIKDVTDTTVLVTDLKNNKKMESITTITRRYLFGKISWLKAISTHSYEYVDD